MNDDPFSQSPYRCRLDWGAVGAERAAKRGDIVVIVDVLSFSTAVVQAISRRAVIFPCAEDEDTVTLAKKYEAEIAVKRHQVPHEGRFSLSPLTFKDIDEQTRVILPSLNGGTCVQCSESADYVFAGALVNAQATGNSVAELLRDSGSYVTVIACGEREKAPPHDLRPAIEDYLGAGAILLAIPFDKSPEAQVCEAAFKASSADISNLLWDSVSGRELRDAGFGEDVKLSSQIDLHDIVARLKNGGFYAFK